MLFYNKRFFESMLRHPAPLLEAPAVSDYDLPERYAEFNKQFFGGELPTPIFKWSRSSKTAGAVTYKVRLLPGFMKSLPQTLRDKYSQMIPESMTLELSRFWSRDTAQLDAILLHEMIHVQMVHEGHFHEQHGALFAARRQELSQQSGIQIPETENPADLQMRDIRSKPLGIIYVPTRNKITFVTATWLQARGSEVLHRLPEAELYVIDTPEWTTEGMKHRIMRPTHLWDLEYYKATAINPQLLDDLKRFGKRLTPVPKSSEEDDLVKKLGAWNLKR